MNISRKILISCILAWTCAGLFAQETKTAVSSKQALITDEINLSASDIAVFKEQTMQKVKEFEQYIVTLGNKDEPAEKRNMAEKEALKLFYRNAQMYISFIMPDGTSQVTPRPMEKYLARLKSLPYTKVLIKFYDIAYISEFHKGADGKYYSTATVIQEFSGFTNDQIKYSDVTKKDIEIIVDIVEDKFFQEKRWKIYLGDIKATETKALTRT
ncbi:MAG TPA: hypothetical protein VK155_12075 [Bacteroidales bacterium]|jgi:hypothetical protein|nr:hypothetical protein [Bacteroidales bacterium]